MYQASDRGMGWVQAAIAGGSAVAKLLGGLFGGGDPKADDLSNFESQLKPALLGYARRYQAPVMAFWYGNVLGVTPEGETVSLGPAANGTEADAMVQQTTGVLLADGRPAVVYMYGGPGNLKRYQGGAAAPRTNGAGGGIPPAGGTPWALIAVAGVAGALLFFGGKKR